MVAILVSREILLEHILLCQKFVRQNIFVTATFFYANKVFILQIYFTPIIFMAKSFFYARQTFDALVRQNKFLRQKHFYEKKTFCYKTYWRKIIFVGLWNFIGVKMRFLAYTNYWRIKNFWRKKSYFFGVKKIWRKILAQQKSFHTRLYKKQQRRRFLGRTHFCMLIFLPGNGFLET